MLLAWNRLEGPEVALVGGLHFAVLKGGGQTASTCGCNKNITTHAPANKTKMVH